MQYVVKKRHAFRVKPKNPDRTAYIWVDKEQGAKNISGGSAEIPVNSELPYHAHEAEEIQFVYRGKGIVVIDGKTYPVEPETMVFVPAGVKHTFKNTGSEPLVWVFFYSPPGAEQVLRTMPSE